MADERQRIDKWLWHARVARTRSAAAALAASGHVRVNGIRVEAASKAVKAGDVVTVALDRRVRILKVLGFAARRGPAESVGGLYEEKSFAAADAAPTPGPRVPDGKGRPTKRDRRALQRLTGGGEP